MPNEHLDLVKFDDTNPEARCPCVLLLDTSGSMNGERIRQLNEGLSAFQQSLQSDDLAAMRVEVAIVTFGSGTKIVQDFVSAHAFEAQPLKAGGDTPMGTAINQGLDMVRQRKDTYKQYGVPYYRPWIFMITDGSPTDKWQAAARRIQQEESSKSVAFFTVGVDKADLKTLAKIATRQPLRLKGLNFRDMFVWLSQSLTSISHSQVDEQVPLQSPTGWSIID